jgi:hypothetical protein
MRKAALVLATSVAFLLFVVPNSYAGIKKKVQLPTSQSVANGSGIPVKSGTTLSIPGSLQGEFIPGDNPSRSTPIKVLPTIDFSIPRTINAAKNLLKNNVATIVIGGTISALLAGVGYLIEESEAGPIITKPSDTSSPISPDSQSYWCRSDATGNTCQDGLKFATALAAIKHDREVRAPYAPEITSISCTSQTSCRGYADSFFYAGRIGSCPGGWLSSGGPCSDNPSPRIPVTSSDIDSGLIDSFANAQNSEWLRDLLRESCAGSISPASCFEDLKDNVSLSGPSTVTGPSSLSTTVGPGGTTTKETKTTFGITYGSDYFIYAPTTTTTTVNPDGTTEVETEEPAPEEEPAEEELDSTIGDPYAPVVDKYNDIAGGVGDLEGNMSFINYGPWYSFGGACSPITLNLPVMGFYTIDHCPYVIDWIRPTLGFLFAVWTWLHCFSLWRETVQNARPI